MHIDYRQKSFLNKNIIKLDDLFADFLLRSTSENTRDAYKRDLKNFFCFLKSSRNFKNIKDISQRHIAGYRDLMLKKELRSDATVARRLSSIKRFFDFLMEKEICDKNPAQGVSRPKIPLIVKTNDLSNDEVLEIFSHINQTNKNGTHNFSGVLHYTILTVMFHVLLRKAEVIYLNFEDFSKDNVGDFLFIRSKGGKKEKIYISEHVSKSIKNYLKIFSVRYRFKNGHPLFVAGINIQKVKYLNKNTIDMIFKKYSKLAGIEHKISPHSSRATGIGNMYEHGASLEDQATYARHSDPRMTFQYNKRRKDKLGHLSSVIDYENEESKEI